MHDFDEIMDMMNHESIPVSRSHLACHKYHLSGNGVSWRNHEMMGAISAKTRFSDVAKRALDAWGEKKNGGPIKIHRTKLRVE